MKPDLDREYLPKHTNLQTAESQGKESRWTLSSFHPLRENEELTVTHS